MVYFVLCDCGCWFGLMVVDDCWCYLGFVCLLGVVVFWYLFGCLVLFDLCCFVLGFYRWVLLLGGL